ncbi:hypothetical protein FPZ12_042830 [Amycolatopsis acidicola]|uniref:Mucin n=1 Tax=Amycolatopsis acidicola TaxID=2596893 RepID=A0A5N0UKY6_9PSEU|nr:DUF6319 family protein [Amycolatopsis acidicola]KAA9149647.1 hypothetical protein FPZ12_042830 [Amycolatopsis acidicola]
MSLDTTTAPQEQAADEEKPADAKTEATEATKSEPAEAGQAEEAPKPKRGRAKGATARKTRTVELTLTVTGTADGDWQAELKHGSTWVARGLAISASAVSRAVKELHEDLATPIDEVINQAREQQKAKVAALEAELEEAKQALAELDS